MTGAFARAYAGAPGGAAGKVAARLAADGNPWRTLQRNGVTLSFAGTAFNASPEAVADTLAKLAGGPSADDLCKIAFGLDGHFAFAASGDGWAVAAVDRVRSIPVFYARCAGEWTIDNRADRLRRKTGLGPADIDRDAALAIGMAGYSIDRATLYRGLAMLAPGDCVLFCSGQEPQLRRYYTYAPWKIESGDEQGFQRRLRDVTLAIFEKHLKSLGGRPLVVPLSAGYDSRLVASAAKHLGYRNVRTFTYGRAGNFEADASRAIAERLGFPWQFVPSTVRGQRAYLEGGKHAAYIDFADSCASSPFEQDAAPLIVLKRSGYVPDDAVLANGNSGDYISGNHVLPKLRQPAQGLSETERRERVVSALADKHFSLWQHLRTPENLSRIRDLLHRSIEAANATAPGADADHGVYEYAEFQDRQCKYVITGQRIYEFLGHDWRLPLWDNEYLDFWQGVPLPLKSGQSLYARMLHEENWGGVWTDIPVNDKTIRPLWIVPPRLLAKAAFAPLGVSRWHSFERRFLTYWMDATCNSACVPYWRTAMDRRGARLSVSWLAELYLARHGVNLDDLALQA